MISDNIDVYWESENNVLLKIILPIIVISCMNSLVPDQPIILHIKVKINSTQTK